MSGLEFQKQEFKSFLLPEILYEAFIPGPGQFSFNFCFGILDLLIRYSIQPTKKIFNCIKRIFDDYKEKMNLKVISSYPKTETEFFFAILEQITDNQHLYTQRLKWLQYYIASPNENHRKGLEEGMKNIICWFFEDDLDMVNMIKSNNENQKLNQILTKISMFFQIKVVMLENNNINEYGLENAPIIYMKHEYGRSSVLYTKDMIEMEYSTDFDVEKLENPPFMSKKITQMNYKIPIPEACMQTNLYNPVPQQVINPPMFYNQKNTQICYENLTPINTPNQNLNLPQSKNYAKTQNFLRSNSPSILRPPIPPNIFPKTNKIEEPSLDKTYEINTSDIKFATPKNDIKNLIHIPNSTKSTLNLLSPEIPEDIIDLIKTMGEIIFYNKVHNEDLIKKIAFCAENYKEIKEIKEFESICNFNDHTSEKLEVPKDRIQLKGNENSITKSPQDLSNEAFYNKHKRYENSPKDYEIVGNDTFGFNMNVYQNSKSMNCLYKVDDKKLVGNTHVVENNLPQNLPFTANTQIYDINIRPPQSSEFKTQNQCFIPAPIFPGFNTEIRQNLNLSSPKESDFKGPQMISYPKSLVALNPTNRYGQARNSPIKIMCQNDKTLLDEDNFLDVECSDQCKICKKCRLLNITQCIRCKRYYTENEKELLDIAKISD
ncbi:hypothetical protein SteCoe_25885 [Stentor coeruleus]|uniref:Uncharacterized protein n=1 Tax=Stentor coeruleus TaxID=5963 RepID=A0A1R2BE92_9CILI|nr:hypothetical protein SteCoe_25885 [Stentor coeruleus]